MALGIPLRARPMVRRAGVAVLSVLALAAIGESIGRENPEDAYGVYVGEVAVTHHVVNDFWSDPDLMVRVQRQDPVVLDQVHGLYNRIREMERESKALSEQIRLLQEKKKASEVTPGQSLTEAQVERLTVLVAEEATCAEFSGRSDCYGCSPYDETEPCPQCAKCAELKYLTERKAESEIVPGEPLDEEESRQLDALVKREAELEGAISSADTEHDRLVATITGYTSSVETKMREISYGYRKKLLTVFPGDALEVAVLDDDVSGDDLYGKTTIILNRRMLEGGDMELLMPNVRHVRLRFQPTGSNGRTQSE